MDRLQPQKWRQLIVFVCITFATLGSLMAIAETYSPEVPVELFSSRVGAFASRFFDLSNVAGRRMIPPYDAETRTITLAVGESVELDRIRIVYGGLAPDDKIMIEVIVPELDREMAYRHLIDIRQAKRGFRLYLDQFELIAAKSNRLQLRYVSPFVR